MSKQRTFKKTNVFKPFSFSLDFFSLERFRLCLYFKQLLFRFRLPLFFAHHISRRIHTHKRIVLLLVKICCCSHLSLCFERASEHLSLKKKEVSIEEKRGTSLSFTSSSRLPDPWGEISQSSVFSLKISLDETTVVYEYAPRGGTPTLFFNGKTQSIILSRGRSVLFYLAIEKKKRLSLRNPFLPTLTTTTTKKERRD